MAVEHLLKNEGICFDAVYTRVQTFRKSDEFQNYNQIYTDFGICDLNKDPNLVGVQQIQEKVILVAPICLTNDDIKSSEEQALLFHQNCDIDDEPNLSNKLTLKGIPIESEQYVPLIFLVPHCMQQNFLYAVSFSNISNTLTTLLVASWQDRVEIRDEV